MATNQRNLMFLALRQELIGIKIHTNKGDFIVIEFIDYDSLTHNFTLKVQNVETDEVIITDFSDKYRYEVEQISSREYPNDKRLRPRGNW